MSVSYLQLLPIHVMQNPILNARRQEHQLCVQACRASNATPIRTAILRTMPGTDKFVTFLLKRPTQVQANVSNSFRLPIDLIYKNRTPEKVDSFGSLFR